MTPGTHDCAPTLTDAQIFDFCCKGYLVLPAVVPDEVNRRVMDFVSTHTAHQPMELLTAEWFIDGIFKNPAAAGAVRSLLGPDFKLPQNFCNHRVECPQPPQGWHRDGGSIYTERLDYLQVFYYPQDVPPEFGPTEVIPGRHHLPHRLLDLAPPQQQHRNRHPQHAQIQLLAHRASAPRLAERSRFRPLLAANRRHPPL